MWVVQCNLVQVPLLQTKDWHHLVLYVQAASGLTLGLRNAANR